MGADVGLEGGEEGVQIIVLWCLFVGAGQEIEGGKMAVEATEGGEEFEFRDTEGLGGHGVDVGGEGSCSIPRGYGGGGEGEAHLGGGWRRGLGGGSGGFEFGDAVEEGVDGGLLGDDRGLERGDSCSVVIRFCCNKFI